MVNNGMNRRVLLLALLVGILCVGTFAFFTKMPSTIQISSVTNDTNGKLDSKVLGDVVKFINVNPYDYWEIEYLNGFLWAVEQEGDLYKLNPETGKRILNISLPFKPMGLTTDGTYFYISSEINGTIFKYTLDGTLVASLYIELPFDGIAGLACAGRDLYAVPYGPTGPLYRIDLDSWAVTGSVPLSARYAGLTYHDGLLWAIAWILREIHALDPDTGQVREVFNNPSGTSMDWGLACNGTHLIVSNYMNYNIYFLDIPTQAGEVWNQYASPYSHPLDIAWNGTNYFLTDTDSNKVYILDEVTFEDITQFQLPFDPLGIAVVGNYLYISQETPPYNLYKYTLQGVLVATFFVAHGYYALWYDGTKLWGTDQTGNFIRQIDPSDGHIIASYDVGVNYVGLVFDSMNNVYWAVDWKAYKICQLNPTSFEKTGVEFFTPTTIGEYGLEFDGEYLILTSWSTDLIYKIIISFPENGGGIPGFTDMFLLLSIMAIVSILSFLKQARTSLRKM